MKEPIIHEVGLRDGLQIEKQILTLEEKIELAEMLIDSGVKIIQLGSFVHPKKVPQMANTDALFQKLQNSTNKKDDIAFSGLVLNERGFERGLACGVEMFCLGVSASNTHSQKNTGMTTAEALNQILPLIKSALSQNKKVQVSVQSAFGCGYEGAIDKSIVLDIVKRYLDAGAKMISLADTAGYAYPDQVHELFSSVKELDDEIELVCHFHDTFGLGMLNCYEAYKTGVRYYETSFGGLGGCPFTKIASGNVCTEDLVYLFKRIGINEMPNIDILLKIVKKLSVSLNRNFSGRLFQAGKPHLEGI